MRQDQISEFGIVLLFMIGALAFMLVGLLAAKLLRPDRPNIEKLSSYECGEEAVGNAWGQFNVKFYVIALIFLLFEVEIIFLFPWATVFGNERLIRETDGLWGWFAVAEVFIFAGILALGLAYAWKKGFLDWIRPQQKIKDHVSPVPRALYDQVNDKYAQKK